MMKEDDARLIEQAVTDLCGISIEDMHRTKKFERASRPKKLLYYLLWQRGFKTREIAERYARYGATLSVVPTVLARIKRDMRTDAHLQWDIKETINYIENELCKDKVL